MNGANLRGADLFDANLLRANLFGADLTHAKDWTEAQLRAPKSLRRATMPNGQKYEDWLKSKGRGKDEENTGPS
jgi:uncharacterized protein YjbI with pentapeptide repeats